MSICGGREPSWRAVAIICRWFWTARESGVLTDRLSPIPMD
jgi:hypothetical protein